MDRDATWYVGWPKVQATLLDGDPYLRKQGHTSPPNFRPISIVAKRLDEW